MPTVAGVRSKFMVSAIKAGRSANSTLAELRANGLGLRRETFLSAWQELVAGLAAREAVASAPLESFPTSEHIRPWDAATSARYSYQVEIQVREQGESEAYTRYFGVNSDILITFEAAHDAAMELATAQGESYGFVPISGIVSGVYEGTG